MSMSRNLKVLIADNDRVTLERFKKMDIWLENGFEVTAAAANISEAVRAVKTKDIDLVLCHNKPPLLTAPTVMKEIFKVCGSRAFIVVSPTDDSEYMRECFLLGATDYLVEPVDEIRIGNALSRARSQLRRSVRISEYEQTVNEFFDELYVSSSVDRKFLGELKNFILSCENVTATTEYAADHFGFNKDYFGRLFKSKLGMTFGDFYKQFRIRYAERLLSSGRYKVYEVSEMLGFASVDYFTSVFKKISGRKPSDFKK